MKSGLYAFFRASVLKMPYRYKKSYRLFDSFGWKMGLEPTTLGTTIRCSNLLSYIHHFGGANIR